MVVFRLRPVFYMCMYRKGQFDDGKTVKVQVIITLSARTSFISLIFSRAVAILCNAFSFLALHCCSFFSNPEILDSMFAWAFEKLILAMQLFEVNYIRNLMFY